MCSYGFHTGYPTILCHHGDAVAGGEARLYYGDHPSAEGTREFAFRPISFHRTGKPAGGSRPKGINGLLLSFTTHVHAHARARMASQIHCRMSFSASFIVQLLALPCSASEHDIGSLIGSPLAGTSSPACSQSCIARGHTHLEPQPELGIRSHVPVPVVAKQDALSFAHVCKRSVPGV